MWKWLNKNEVLLGILTLVVLIRLPSLFEPYWYRDEGIYLTIGQAINHGAALYKDIADYPSKPPLLYLMAALAKGSLFWFKFLGLVWSLGTVFVFWLVANKWQQNKKGFAAWTSVVLGLLVSWPMLEGNSINAELLFLLPNLVAVYLLLTPGHNPKIIYLAGLAIGIASLFKFQAGMELLVWPMVWIIQREAGLGEKMKWLLAGWGTPIMVSLAWSVVMGTLGVYIKAVTVGNLAYVDRLNLAEITLWSAAAVVAVAYFRTRLNRFGVVWCVWGIVALAAALVSGRPFPHYLLQITPVVALGVGLLFAGSDVQKTVCSLGLGVVVCVWLTGNYFRYPTVSYFANFLAWSWGQKSDREYMAWFGPQVVPTYDFSKAIMSNSLNTESVYVWGDDSLIYPLAQRDPAFKYTVDFHVSDLGLQNNLVANLEQRMPRYIVTEKEAGQINSLNNLLATRYLLEREEGDKRLYRRLGYSRIINP